MISGAPAFLLMVLGVLVLAVLFGTIVAFIIVPVFKGIGFLIMHVFGFIAGMLRDSFRAVGAIPAAVVFAVLSVLNVVIGRWSAAAHFGANVQHECKTFLACLYRVGVSHPLHLIGLGPMLEGIEQRVPAAVAESPGADRPSRRTGQFEGYTVVGSLPSGGSGGRLYIAEPTADKRARLERALGQCPQRVVIKSFAIADGSDLPQIVRESRALEGAKQMGLVLEHELASDRFHYVMPYVPGDHLGAVVRQVHARCGESGLGEAELHEILGYVGDLVETLDQYHRNGLWHKDIKPENVIVHAGRAHLVDLGLVTPLRSAMTLTTHGTEYFRDPEMVRLALRGVKVHEVDGAKFDIYGAGAVMYYAIENTFPSHGGLSTVTRRCPEAVKWIVRRAMTDYNHRYSSAATMLADLEAVRRHPNVHAMRPAELPSMRDEDAATARAVMADDARHHEEHRAGGAFAGFAPPAAAVAAAMGAGSGFDQARRRPALRVTNWWTGRFEPDRGEGVGPRPAPSPQPFAWGGACFASRGFQRAAEGIASGVGSGWCGVKSRFSRRSAVAAADAAAAAAMAAAGEAIHAAGAAVVAAAAPGAPASPFASPPPRVRFGGGPRSSAAEQIAHARRRASERRRRAAQYRHGRRAAMAPCERINLGMVIAGVAVVGAVGAAAVVKKSRDATRASIDAREFAINGRAEGDAIAQAARAIADATDSAVAAIATFTVTEEVEDVVSQLPPHYIVINDHPDFLNEKVRAQAERIDAALQAAGLQPYTDKSLAAEVETRVRYEVSQIVGPNVPVDDIAHAEAVVGPLLGVDPELAELGCIVWLAQGREGGDRVLTWVLTPDCHDEETDETLLNYLQYEGAD